MGKHAAVVFVMLAVLCGVGRADTTYVSGQITSNTTWDYAHSPYVVTGSVLVNEGVRLTIEPGVVVLLGNVKALQVNGTLVARGTEGSPIRFDRYTPSSWGFILFADSSVDAEFDVLGQYVRGCIMEYCTVKHGGGAAVSNNGAIRTQNASPFLSHCILDSSSSDGINVHNEDGSIRIAHSTVRCCGETGIRVGWDGYSIGGLTVLGCSLCNNGGGLDVASDGLVEVDSCVIEGNSAEPGTYGCLIFMTSGAGQLYLADSRISNNHYTGVYVVGGQAVVRNCDISGNSAYRGAGMYLTTTRCLVDNCRISYNTADSYFGGIWMFVDSTTIQNSVISHNQALGHGGWDGDAGGIHAEGYSGSRTLVVRNSIVCDNVATASGGGIASGCYYGHPVTLALDRTVIAGNLAQGIGGGLYLKGTVRCSCSAIVRNEANENAAARIFNGEGRVTHSTVTGNLGLPARPDTFAACYIDSSTPLYRCNLISNDTLLDLYNGNSTGSPVLNAEDNWWGTASESEIQGKIYDWFDNSSLGIVDYTPWATSIRSDCPISPPTGVAGTGYVDSVVVTWQANSESDLAGYIVYWDTTSSWPYSNSVDVGNVTQHTIRGLAPDDYYVTVTAYDNDYSPANDDPNTIVNDNQTSGNESWFAQGVSVEAVACDVGVTGISTPTGVVDSGQVVIPRAAVGNLSSVAVTCTVAFRIGGFYSQSRSKSLSAGASDTVGFPAWTATQRGRHTTRCWTVLAGDINPSNDSVADSVFVRVADAGVTSIVALPDTVDTNDVITPQAWVRNYGSRAESFPVRFRIGSVYADTQNVSSLGPGESTLVSFDQWTARQRGTYAAACSTALTGEQKPTNDKSTKSVAVRVKDAAVLAITAPVGVVDSGATISPKARVKNPGSVSASFPVWFRIDSAGVAGFSSAASRSAASMRRHLDATRLAAAGMAQTGHVYEESVWVSLNPGDSVEKTFPSWVARTRGALTTKCTTAYVGDANPGNDSRTGSVTVQLLDAQVISIDAPRDTVMQGSTNPVRATVRNNGNTQQSITARFKMNDGSGYEATQSANLAPGVSLQLAFPDWTADYPGSWIPQCSTELAGDQVHDNDRQTGSVLVQVLDAQVISIDAPRDTVMQGSTNPVRVTVRNNGNTQQNITARFKTSAPLYNEVGVANNVPANGGTASINFPDWTAVMGGNVSLRCSTELAGDMSPDNDKMTGEVFVLVATLDAQTVSVDAPVGTVEQGATVAPKATIRNNGNTQQSITARFRIDDGSGYDAIQSASLAPGASTQLTFADWTASALGFWTPQCSTELAGDEVSDNDRQNGAVLVQLLDAGAVSIDAPAGTIDSGAVLKPKATIQNYGNTRQSITARFRINDGSGYDETRSADLDPGVSVQLEFPDWVADYPGSWVPQCSTELAGDRVSNNDRAQGSVTVVLPGAVDVSTEAIVAPSGTVDSGVTVIPSALVKNSGGSPASFSVRMKVGNSYDDTSYVHDLASGASDTVVFAQWTADQPGTQAVSCSTALAGDQYPGNDMRTDSVFVRTLDALTVSVDAPAGVVDAGTSIAPKATIQNNGNVQQSITARFRIDDGSGYEKVQSADLDPGESVQLTFADWTADNPGSWAPRCSTELAGDRTDENDCKTGSVLVQLLDARTTSIDAPSGAVSQGATIAPKATIRNSGNTQQNITARFKINDGSGYEATRSISLAPGASGQLTFPDWTADRPGSWVSQCSTELSGDRVNGNDRAQGSVIVSVPGGLDVGTDTILVPSGVLDSGMVVTPSVQVKNYGDSTASFGVRMRVGDFYQDEQQVSELAPGASIAVSFTQWTVAERGEHAVSCSTALSGDQHPDNDRQSGTVFVRVLDAQVVSIDAPKDTVTQGSANPVRASIRNNGNTEQHITARFKIPATGYDTIGTAYSVPANGGTATVAFPDWIPSATGVVALQCSTELAGDVNSGNDRAQVQVTVESGGESVFDCFTYPNPCEQQVVFAVSAHEQGALSLAVYNRSGALVWSKMADAVPGVSHITWDLRGANGRRVALGNYQYVLEYDHGGLTERLVSKLVVAKEPR